MAEPFPGLKIAAPERTPQQGEVVIRYEVREPKAGCCQCSDMNQSGLIALVALIFVCWPLACIPCCMAEPFPGLKIAAPERTPQQGEVVIRYEVREPGGVLPVLGHESIGPHRARRPHLRLLAPCLHPLLHEELPRELPGACLRAARLPAACVPIRRATRTGHPHDRQGLVKGGATRGSRAPPPRRRELCGGVLLIPCHAVSSIILPNLRACHFPKLRG